MTPMLEVDHCRLRLLIEIKEPLDLAIVEQISNDSGDVVRGYTGSNILTVSTTISRSVVRINARLRDGLSARGKAV